MSELMKKVRAEYRGAIAEGNYRYACELFDAIMYAEKED
jgi:hypothetical protein